MVYKKNGILLEMGGWSEMSMFSSSEKTKCKGSQYCQTVVAQQTILSSGKKSKKHCIIFNNYVSQLQKYHLESFLFWMTVL